MNYFMYPKFERILSRLLFLTNLVFKLVFGGDKIIVIKGNVFVGKGYVCNGMYKLRLMRMTLFMRILPSIPILYGMSV